MKKQTIIKIIRWTARIWSILIILLHLVIFFGYIFYPETDGETWRTIEIIAAIFYPVGVLIGMIIAWKKELLGGIISLVGYLIFTILILIPRGAIVRMFPMVLIVNGPGILFFINGVLMKRK